MTSNNIKVCVKVRPLIEREKNENLPTVWSLIDKNTIKSSVKDYKLCFDHIFDENRTTEELFETIAKPIVTSAISGINGTIFAYGQTSSGKTYCMMGTDPEPGIIPLCVNEIFNQIEQIKDREFLVRIGYIEIYNEKIYDLLTENKPEITKIHETNGEVAINQTEIVTASAQTIMEQYEAGNKERRVGETHMNERSSRSHTIFRIVIESHEIDNDGVFHVSTLNLVDLAGSERVDQTKATGERLREGGHINKSLLSLSKVIRELSGELNDDKGKNSDVKYINYRDSKLTRILSASLGGNAMTAIICTITPVALEESYSTLTFASNAKKIKNQPKVNETVSDKVIMNRLQKEISVLKTELEEEKSRNSEVSKIEKLIAQIFDRESQIIHYNSNMMKRIEMNRRRTWCPSSTMGKIVEEEVDLIRPKSNHLAPPPFVLSRQETSPEVPFSSSNENFLSEEVFQSPDNFQFGDCIQTDMTTNVKRDITHEFPSQFRTPKSLKPVVEMDSPPVGKPATVEEENMRLKLRIEYLENELEELKDFKVVEELAASGIDGQVKILEEQLNIAHEELTEKSRTIELLENDMSEKMIEMEQLQSMKSFCDAIEVERKKALQERDQAQNLLGSVEYEYELAREKFKKRENELVNSLTEARKESSEAENVQKEKIKSLEQILLKTEQDLFALQSQKSSEVIATVESSKITDLHKTIQDLENRLREVTDEKSVAEKALKEINKEFEELSDQLIEALQNSDNQTASIENLQQQLSEKDEKLAELEVISNRYQKIQQIVTVDETITEFVVDENDDVSKFIVELRYTATRFESENKQLMTQIAENNRVNEEMEQLHNRIKELEGQIVAKSESEVHLAKGSCQTESFKTVSNDFECQTEEEILPASVETAEIHIQTELEAKIAGEFHTNRVAQCEAECQTEMAQAYQDTDEKAMQTTVLETVQQECQTEVIIPQVASSEIQTDHPEHSEGECQTELELEEIPESLPAPVLIETEEKDIQTEMAVAVQQECQTDVEDVLTEFNEKLKELNEQVSTLEGENVQLKADLFENEKTIEEYHWIQQLLTDVNLTNEHCDEANEYINIINNLRRDAGRLETVEIENLRLAEIQESLQQKISELTSNIEELQIINQSQESENQELNDKLSEQLKSLEAFNRIQSLVANNESISEDYFNDSFGKQIFKLHQSASRSESLENEKMHLLNEIEQIRQTAQILTEKLTANQTLTETEFQLREKIEELEEELSVTRKQVEEQLVKLNDFKMNQLDLQIKIVELTKEKEASVSDLKSSLQMKTDEVVKLQELANEQRTKINAYESEISELTSKLEHAKDQNLKLVDSTAECASEMAKLDAELTNCRSQLVIKNEEFKGLVRDCDTLKEQIATKTMECSELKTRYRRRSEDNVRKVQELEKLNSKLLQDVGAAEAMKISAQQNVQRLAEEYNATMAELKSLQEKLNDNDMKYAILDEKYSHLCSINMNLESQLMDKITESSKHNERIKILELEISELNEKISLHTSENEIKSQMVHELRQKCEKLVEEVKECQFKPKKSSSPVQNRRSDEKELFSLHVPDGPTAGTPARTVRSNIDRKSRRQSCYDERRDLSAWEMTQSESTQTDPNNDLCACNDLNRKIKDLQIEIRLKDSKIANTQRMANVNRFKYELEDAKNEILQEKRENSQLKEQMENLKRKLRDIQSKNNELEINQKCSDVHGRGAQTEGSVVSMEEHAQLMNEKNIMESKLEDLKTQLSQLKAMSEKENVSTNTPNRLNKNASTESGISNTMMEYEELQVEYNKMQKKYDTAKRLCNLRNDDLTKLREDLRIMTAKADLLSRKYENAKKLCETRMEKIRALREQLGVKDDQTATISFGDSLAPTHSC